jgi:hypothetical protein
LTARAELIADSGVAAVGDEFFRSPPFLEAEGASHTLRIDTGSTEILAPLIVRPIEGSGLLDAISPYGYTGAKVRGKGPGGPVAVDPDDVDFSATGLVTVFLRHTLDQPPLSGASERNIVQIADPDLPPKSRMSDRQQIRKNLGNGYELRLVPGPDTVPAERAGFLAAYEQTMRRAGAAERYFFGAAYFDRILGSSLSWLVLAHAPGEEIAAASIAVRSDGFIHYYLSGTADAHLRDSPMKNVVATLVEFSSKHGLPLNLGGGISRGDRLEEFKRGFANREAPWQTSEIVCDLDAYERLSAGHTRTGFFPAYRAPK